MAALRRLGLAAEVEARGLPVEGMIVTGDGVEISGRYPGDLRGRAIRRSDFDWILLRAAIEAGCAFEPGTAVRRAVVDVTKKEPTVRRVDVARRSGAASIFARAVIAADGRRSTLAFDLGFLRHPSRPRRWAIGAYFVGVTPPAAAAAPAAVLGEMHIRRDRYVGVAPIPDGLTNVCLVRPSAAGDLDFRDPAAALTRAIAGDPMLRDRFSGATASPPPRCSALAVDATGRAPIDGLLFAGDARLHRSDDRRRLALRDSRWRARRSGGFAGVDARMDRSARRARGGSPAAFAGKWRFNRALRAVVARARRSVARWRTAGAFGAARDHRPGRRLPSGRLAWR
jgi:flavin-dependent dehydrogenase